MSRVINAEKAFKKLNKNTACYVLISCSTPDKDGKMEVEMHYEGDEALAAFLVENACQVFDDRIESQESK
jgi:hypothetical protein